MLLKLSAPAVAGLGALAAFVAYVVAGNFAAASWAGVAALLATVMVWDVWTNHRARA